MRNSHRRVFCHQMLGLSVDLLELVPDFQQPVLQDIHLPALRLPVMRWRKCTYIKAQSLSAWRMLPPVFFADTNIMMLMMIMIWCFMSLSTSHIEMMSRFSIIFYKSDGFLAHQSYSINVWANNVDPNKTQKEAVWSGSTLFAIQPPTFRFFDFIWFRVLQPSQHC